MSKRPYSSVKESEIDSLHIMSKTRTNTNATTTSSLPSFHNYASRSSPHHSREAPPYSKQELKLRSKQVKEFESNSLEALQNASRSLLHRRKKQHEQKQKSLYSSPSNSSSDTDNDGDGGDGGGDRDKNEDQDESQHVPEQNIPGLINQICLDALSNDKQMMTPTLLHALLSLILQFIEPHVNIPPLPSSKNTSETNQNPKQPIDNNDSSNKKSDNKQLQAQYSKRAKLWAMDRIYDLLSPPTTSFIPTSQSIHNDSNYNKSQSSLPITINADIPELDAMLAAVGTRDTLKHEQIVQQMFYESIQDSQDRIRQCLEIWRLSKNKNQKDSEQNNNIKNNNNNNIEDDMDTCFAYEDDIKYMFAHIQQRMTEIQSYYDDILTEEERINYKHDNSSFTAADSINSPPTTNPCTLSTQTIMSPWNTNFIAFYKILHHFSSSVSLSSDDFSTATLFKINQESIPSPSSCVKERNDSKKRPSQSQREDNCTPTSSTIHHNNAFIDQIHSFLDKCDDV